MREREREKESQVHKSRIFSHDLAITLSQKHHNIRVATLRRAKMPTYVCI